MIQTRRSVSSSPSSESENNDLQENIMTHIPNIPSIPTISIEMGQAPNKGTMRISKVNEKILSYSAPQQSIQNLPDQSGQFNVPSENGPVSLFPPTSGPSQNTKVPFPSPGTAMFPPTFVNAFTLATSTANAQPSSKHGDTPVLNSAINSSINFPQNICAAFTSSSRNIALTTSMMAPSPVQSDMSSIASPNENTLITSVPPHTTGESSNNNNNINSNNKIDFNCVPAVQSINSPQMQTTTQQTQSIVIQQKQELSGANQSSQSNHQTSSQRLLDSSYNFEDVPNDSTSTSEKQIMSDRNTTTEQLSKRPTRYNSQTIQATLKSPSKSPGKSPRQLDIVRQKSDFSRGRLRGARNTGVSRGSAGTVSTVARVSVSSRGRGRSRAPLVVPLSKY